MEGQDMVVLDKPAVCDRLMITRRHLDELIRRGDIPCFRIGRLIRFDSDRIDAWIDAAHVTSRAE